MSRAHGVFLAAAIAFAAVPVWVLEAGAVVLCKSRTGAIVLRERCRRPRQQLSQAELGAIGPKGDPGPRGSGTRVVDADGKEVGPLLDASGGVAVRIGDRVVKLQADKTGFRQNVLFDHTSGDCSGRRYLSASGHLLPTTVVNGASLYIETPPVRTLAVHSREYAELAADCLARGDDPLPGGLCCDAVDFGDRELAEFETVDLGSLGFVVPFHVEVIP
ncbi:MAG: hypothetical protein U0807_11485 [Candidatus Binatia bacterium]